MRAFDALGRRWKSLKRIRTRRCGFINFLYFYQFLTSEVFSLEFSLSKWWARATVVGETSIGGEKIACLEFGYADNTLSRDLFKNYTNYFLSQIGAISSTGWLERNLSWRGVLILTDPRSFFEAHRSTRNPKTRVLHACLSTDKDTKEVSVVYSKCSLTRICSTDPDKSR